MRSLRILGIATLSATLGAALSAAVVWHIPSQAVSPPRSTEVRDPCAAERAFRYRSIDELEKRDRAAAQRVAEILGFSRELHGTSTTGWAKFKDACASRLGTFSVESPDAKIVQCKFGPTGLSVNMNWVPGGDTLDVMVGDQRVGGWGWLSPGIEK